ncbi:transcription factor HES-5-like [Periophthalmus magnuspinnatus]|uniref:transcription factor HES-5-like n=1 Tax=Periophthalmus magnuspinnatus TaxID=409849 RepID=UPI00145A6E8F|nr:transcription factor HES-5-like [Periophthalmus magnuspinnatus]
MTHRRSKDKSLDIPNKLRKLVVEKVRRERINHSIEQLKVLLNLEEQEPSGAPCRLEKADVLEMAVCFLRQRAIASAVPSYSQGFSQCLQETLRHLSLHAPLQHAQREEIKRFYVVQRAALHRHIADEHSTNKQALWRPW